MINSQLVQHLAVLQAHDLSLFVVVRRVLSVALPIIRSSRWESILSLPRFCPVKFRAESSPPQSCWFRVDNLPVPIVTAT